jgi:hypothetical protein
MIIDIPTKISTSLQLYKYLIRSIRKLPTEPQRIYYKNYVKNHYRNHKEETDPVRIQSIIDRSIENTNWILKKYLK